MIHIFPTSTQAPVRHWDNLLYTCLPSDFAHGNPFTTIPSNLILYLSFFGPLKLRTYFLSAFEPLLTVPAANDFLTTKALSIDASRFFDFVFFF